MTMPGGGVFSVGKGQITDDSELALSLARGLLGHRPSDGFPLESVARHYAAWCDSKPFDIGNTCATAFGVKPDASGNYAAVMTHTAASHCSASEANGSLMRIAPLAIWCVGQSDDTIAALASTEATLSHPNQVCQDCNVVYCLMLEHLLRVPGDLKGALDRAERFINTKVTSVVRTWFLEESLDISDLGYSDSNKLSVLSLPDDDAGLSSLEADSAVDDAVDVAAEADADSVSPDKLLLSSPAADSDGLSTLSLPDDDAGLSSLGADAEVAADDAVDVASEADADAMDELSLSSLPADSDTLSVLSVPDDDAASSSLEAEADAAVDDSADADATDELPLSSPVADSSEAAADALALSVCEPDSDSNKLSVLPLLDDEAASVDADADSELAKDAEADAEVSPTVVFGVEALIFVQTAPNSSEAASELLPNTLFNDPSEPSEGCTAYEPDDDAGLSLEAEAEVAADDAVEADADATYELSLSSLLVDPDRLSVLSLPDDDEVLTSLEADSEVAADDVVDVAAEADADSVAPYKLLLSSPVADSDELSTLSLPDDDAGLSSLAPDAEVAADDAVDVSAEADADSTDGVVVTVTGSVGDVGASDELPLSSLDAASSEAASDADSLVRRSSSDPLELLVGFLTVFTPCDPDSDSDKLSVLSLPDADEVLTSLEADSEVASDDVVDVAAEADAD
ncbi:hypothetical protein PHMEG_00020221 [Phytophthora megakarya]|uniref:Uncharacterized protein n=1 Tax=Phytophthora megakarya TaxID=4795 RepID=A0A225VPW4_9STRA|nr:hypothetical protein PHMEG_00020221 [Phytophthora megakarya]